MNAFAQQTRLRRLDKGGDNKEWDTADKSGDRDKIGSTKIGELPRKIPFYHSIEDNGVK